jgi:hypothetical protein
LLFSLSPSIASALLVGINFLPLARLEANGLARRLTSVESFALID